MRQLWTNPMTRMLCGVDDNGRGCPRGEAGNTALREVYGRRMRRVSGLGSRGTYDKVRSILEDDSSGYDLLGGHVPFGMHRYTDRPCHYVTVLRDPTRIILSRYFKRYRPEVWKRKKLRAGGPLPICPPPQLPDRPLVETMRQLSANPMTRMLCGVDDNGRGCPKGEITRDHLERAKYNLRHHFSAIAILERFQQSMLGMAADLGWESTPTIKKSNSGTNRPAEYPDEVYEVGREVNALDYELYAFAQALLDERLQKHGISATANGS